MCSLGSDVSLIIPAGHRSESQNQELRGAHPLMCPPQHAHGGLAREGGGTCLRPVLRGMPALPPCFPQATVTAESPDAPPTTLL